MDKPQFIVTPTGERLVVLSEQDYTTLLEQAENYHDIQAANEARGRIDAGVVILPSIGGHRSKRSFGPRRPLG